MDQLTLTQSQVDQMIAHARAAAPLEACGLLGGKDGCVLHVFPATNAAHSPTRYLVEPADLLDALTKMEAQGWGLDPLAIFHSHPTGPETPSEIDVAESHYPNSVHVIIAHPHLSSPSVRGFRIADAQVSQVQLKIVDDQKGVGNSQLQVTAGV